MSVHLCCKTCEEPRPEVMREAAMPAGSVSQANNNPWNPYYDDIEIWAKFRISLINKNGTLLKKNGTLLFTLILIVK